MGRTRKGPGPHLVAITASAFVFGSGLAAAAWFVFGRHAEAPTAAAAPDLIELAAVVTSILVLAIVTHVVVAELVRRAAGGSDRRLIRLALDVDATDSEALRPFDSAPELRELVSSFVTQKAHVHELSDRIEALRGEINGLTDAMRRSVQDLGRLREESTSNLGVQIVVLWNGLIERVRHAEELSAQAEARDGSTVPAGRSQGDLETLVNRLDELESDLARLRTAMATPVEQEETVVSAPAAPQRMWQTPAVAPAARPPLTVPSELFIEEDAAPPVRVAPPVAPAPQVRVAPSVAPAPQVRVAPSVAPAPQVRVAPPVQAAPPAYAAAPGRVAPATAGQRTATSTVDADPTFDDMNFPHFVGRPVASPQDHIEVTYEARPHEEVAELPASALLLESEPEADPDEEKIFDLGSFGAREFES